MANACSTSAFKVPLDEALGHVRRLGFTHVDLIAIKGWPHIQPPELAADFDAVAGQIESLLEKHGLTPVAINMALAHPHQRNPETNAQRLKEADAVARLMKRLGIAIASYYPGYKAEDRPWEDVLTDSVATMRELSDVAAGHGVRFVPEPHFATPFQTVEQGRRLLEAMPELQVAYDPSHYVMQGIDVRDTLPLIERAAHVHLRDAAEGRMQAPFGEGDTDFDFIFDALAKRGYTGHASIEYLPNFEGDLDATLTGLKAAMDHHLD